MLACLAFAGCGGSGSSGASDVAVQLSRNVESKGQGRLTGTKCIKRTDTTFRCAADYQVSRDLAEKSMSGIDTSNFTEKDWDAVIAQQSGPTVFDVTVDPADGTFIYEPR